MIPRKPANAVHRHRADDVVDAHLLLDPVADVDDEHRAEHREQVAERRRVDVGAGGDADHAGEAARDGPERVAAAGEVAAGEAAREPERDDHRDRAERGRAEVDVRPARERGRRDHQAGGVEGVEAGEDQHQPHQGHMDVVGSEDPGQALLRVLAYSRSEVEQDAEREGARDAVHDRRGDRVVEAEAQRHPAAGAPAPGGVEDPDDRAEQARRAPGTRTAARARAARPT